MIKFYASKKFEIDFPIDKPRTYIPPLFLSILTTRDIIIFSSHIFTLTDLSVPRVSIRKFLLISPSIFFL